MNAQQKAARIRDLRAQIEGEPAAGTARGRLALLFDEGTFVEVGAFVRQRPGDLAAPDTPEAVVTGYGSVDGTLVFAFAQDAAVEKGALSEMHARKIKTLLSMAIKADAPVVSFLDSCGMKISEGMDALAGYGEILSLCGQMQGVIPHVCVVNGVCAGAMSFLPAYADYTVAVKGAELFLSAPSVVAARGGDAKGDAQSAWNDGVVSQICEDDAAAVAAVKEFFNAFSPAQTDDDINRLTPQIGTLLSQDGYDVRKIIAAFADDGKLTELSAGGAQNMVTALIHLDGVACGVVANQPAVNGGALDAAACVKAAKMIEFCDSYGLPVITLTDTPGFDAEHAGDLADCAALVSAYTSSDTVKLTLITGRAFGAGYLSMGAKHTGADVVLAYPTAQIAPLPADTGAVFLGAQQVAQADEPAEKRKELIARYADTFADPLPAARRGYVDDIVEYATTRQLLISSLNLFLEGEE